MQEEKRNMGDMTWERAADLSDFYQLMAAAFRYPDRELAEGIYAGTFAADAADCLKGLGVLPADADAVCGQVTRDAVSGAGSPEELYEQMRVAYTDLFLVPRKEKVFLYESRFCYPEDADPKDYSMFVSPCALHAEQVYREAGVRVKKGRQEPADHMATELEFAAWLYRKAAEALARDEKQEAGDRLRKADDFERKHLARWYEKFLQAVSEKTGQEIYRSLAVLGGMLTDVSGSSRRDPD
jgi:TorA maturation chaperone TorD